MEKPSSRYQYSPVNSAGAEIRILTIRAGAFSDPFDLSLDVRNISTNTSPPPSIAVKPESLAASIFLDTTYEALSYVWGSQTDLVDIAIGPSKARLSITRNLATAIPFLRLPSKDRKIWIDAICIDQSNFQERGLQVQLMAKIYQQAAQVICWVGLESPTSELAIRTIRGISKRVEVDIPRQKTTPLGKRNERWADMSHPLPYNTRVKRALSNFFRRAWFERLWVFQEIRLAGRRALLQCGSSTVEWQKVTNASWCFCNKPWKTSISAGFRRRLEMVRQTYNTNPTNLALLIRRTVHLKCSDPRDRLYALISLRRKDEWKLQVVVDYTKSANKIYQEYVHQYISVLKSLRLLSFCEIQSSHADRPTWVPDWSRPQCANAPRAQQYASGYMTCEVTGITDRVLKVTGLHVAVVQETTVMDIGKGSDSDAVTLIRKCAPAHVLKRSYPGDLSMLEAYCCTMCHDTFSERIAPERVLFPSYSESLEVVRSALEEPALAVAVKPGSSASRYCGLVCDICVGRSLISTTDGGIGLAPATARPGDHVTLILGCRSLMLLRPNEAGEYQIVGLAYLHGMNNAEPLYGPIPRPWRPVMKGDNGVFTEQLFLNSVTGELTNEDPRFVDFRKDEMTEGLYFGTKIPSINALKNRGKLLKTFELI